MALHIWMPCYDDDEQLRKALNSTAEFAEGVTVYVVDGRYATFEGELDHTPGARPLCSAYNHVEYVQPPSLPIGDESKPSQLRSPQHEQAKWVNYELLPGDEWALEMDTDERLEHLDLDALADLNPRRKYTPLVHTPEGEQLKPAIRLYQPEHWTFWIDDVMFWREFYPRDTPLQQLFEAHVQTAHRNTGYGGEVDCIRLRNHGMDRDDDYLDRRADQLETMGTPWAARALRDGERPPLADLREYAEDGEEMVR